MHTIKFLALSSFIYLFVACGSEKKTLAFEILTEGDVFHQNDNIAVSIKNPDKAQITNVVYSIDGKQLNIENGKITLDVEKLGNKTLTAKIGFDQTEAEIAKNIKILSAIEPAIYGYEIVNVYPHDNKAYTQGLEFHQDTLYEGTGKKGRSFLRKVDFTTGKPFAQIDLDPTIVGEGITILNNKIYQLSWQSGMGFIYDLKSFKKSTAFNMAKVKKDGDLPMTAKNCIRATARSVFGS